MAFNLIGAEEDLIIREGSDISIDVKLEDENGPIDITGHTAEMRFSADLDTPAELTLTVGSGIVIDGPNGIITFTITNTQTDALTFENGRYDLELIDGSGLIDPVIYGKATVVQKVPDGS